MLVQLDIKDYYEAFIKNANSDIKKYTEELNLNKRIKDKTKEDVLKYNSLIKSRFNLNLNDYKRSWIIGVYDEYENFTEVINNKLTDEVVGEARIALLQLLRYSKLLKSCHDNNEQIKLAKERADITFKEYKEILRKYYMQAVHKALLEGYAYHFGYGIGDLSINFWRYKDKPRNNYVDWAATKKRKQEIIDAGLKPYDEEEAEIYKIRGIKYDGIPYVVYKTNTEFFNIELCNNKRHRTGLVKFKHANYVPYKFRGKSPEELASELKTIDNLAVQDLGIRHKLVVATTLDPTLYLKFIRNVEQNRYKRGAHNNKQIKKADI